MKPNTTNRRRALLALFFVAPVPSLGVIAAMVAAPGPVGRGFFMAGKLWLLVFPAVWYLWVENGRPSWSPPRRAGLAAGVLSGLVLAAIIGVGAWLADIQHMDLAPLRVQVREMGLGSADSYLAAAAGWTLVNSLIEEYVYRWFIYRQCEALINGPAAILASAAIFSAHHVIAVSRYLEPVLVVIASTGIFFGGAIWSWLYKRYRSVWPCWISHILADIAVFGIGWRLLFNSIR